MLLLPLVALCAIYAASSLVEAAATLPFQGKMRGVNLGGLFVLEPWMAMDNWKNILKCDDVQESEWAYMKKYTDAGQREQGDAAFKQHWENWITEQDIIDIRNMALNTVRIPLGYWIVEDLVQEGEYFPRGGHAQLTIVLQWCTTHGIAAMLVLHAAPGVQAVDQSFAGRQTDSPEFYKPENYERAYKWAANITTSAYTIPGWESVFVIEAVNEPLQQWQSDALPIPGLVDQYYPKFLKTVRDAEAAQGVTCSSGSSKRSKRATASHCLVVTYQDKSWGSYDPTTNLPSLEQTMYDGHAYLKWNPSVELSRSGYLSFAKEQNLAASSPSNDPLFIGEWSLSPSDSAPQDFDPNSDGAKQFYKDFWTAQAASADKGIGYTFWSYKTQTGDFRWDWSLAVKEGVIPSNVGGSPVTSAWRNNSGSGGAGGNTNSQPSQQPSSTPTPSSEIKTGISRQSLTRPIPTFNSGSQIYNGALVASLDIDGKVVVKQTACPPSTRHRRRNAQLGTRRHHAAGQRMSKRGL